METILEIHFEILKKHEEMPRDVRTVFTLLTVPEAQKKLEEFYGKIEILQYGFKNFLTA